MKPKSNNFKQSWSASTSVKLTSGITLASQSLVAGSSTPSNVAWWALGDEEELGSEDFKLVKGEAGSAVFRDGLAAQRDQTTSFVGGIALGVIGSILVSLVPAVYDLFWALISSIRGRGKEQESAQAVGDAPSHSSEDRGDRASIDQ